ncbi:carbamoyltransferase family protein [Spirosoma koreense]
MYTLGINAAFHDPAATLVKDGIVLAAAEEERFTHIKHGKRPIPFSTYELPYNAIDFCLKTAGIQLTDVDHIAYSFDPGLLLGDQQSQPTVAIPLQFVGNGSVDPALANWLNPYDGLFLSSILNAPGHLVDGVPLHLAGRFSGATAQGPYQWHFVNHHVAHAASAFLPSPYQRAAVMVLDGRGEQATTSYWLGEDNHLVELGEVHLPHSLGLMYEQMTTYLGFLHSSDEYKVMALASYGQPVYADYFRQRIKLTGRGGYTIAPLELEETFGPARKKGGPLDQFHFDLAHSVQAVMEETVLALCRWLQQQTQTDSLCLAGGVALNCVMNARLRDQGPFRNVWVQPAAGDAGTALGAAMWIDAQQRSMAVDSLNGRSERRYQMEHAYLGPGFSDDEIESFLRWSKLPYRRLTDVSREVAAYLADGHIIGWFQHRMEFGPRALGARSIIAPPFPAEMQARLNDLKDREEFRPVAPAVLEEAADTYFLNARQSPFMLFVNDVRPEMIDTIPAVTHTDGTARIQTVNEQQNGPYYQLIKAFDELTGVPVLVNTSFNTRGEPVVCTPRDAIESFWTSPLDALVIGSFFLEKVPASAPTSNSSQLEQSLVVS